MLGPGNQGQWAPQCRPRPWARPQGAASLQERSSAFTGRRTPCPLRPRRPGHWPQGATNTLGVFSPGHRGPGTEALSFGTDRSSPRGPCQPHRPVRRAHLRPPVGGHVPAGWGCVACATHLSQSKPVSSLRRAQEELTRDQAYVLSPHSLTWQTGTEASRAGPGVRHGAAAPDPHFQARAAAAPPEDEGQKEGESSVLYI